jgi:hypothetical protein
MTANPAVLGKQEPLRPVTMRSMKVRLGLAQMTDCNIIDTWTDPLNFDFPE